MHTLEGPRQSGSGAFAAASIARGRFGGGEGERSSGGGGADDAVSDKGEGCLEG